MFSNIQRHRHETCNTTGAKHQALGIQNKTETWNVSSRFEIKK